MNKSDAIVKARQLTTHCVEMVAELGGTLESYQDPECMKACLENAEIFSKVIFHTSPNNFLLRHNPSELHINACEMDSNDTLSARTLRNAFSTKYADFYEKLSGHKLSISNKREQGHLMLDRFLCRISNSEKNVPMHERVQIMQEHDITMPSRILTAQSRDNENAGAWVERIFPDERSSVVDASDFFTPQNTQLRQSNFFGNSSLLEIIPNAFLTELRIEEMRLSDEINKGLEANSLELCNDFILGHSAFDIRACLFHHSSAVVLKTINVEKKATSAQI